MREDERELYRLHARLPVYRRHVAAAVEIARRAMREHAGVWAISMSGGKDSTALLSVAIEAGWSGPILHLHDATIPDASQELCSTLAQAHGCPLHVVQCPSAYDVMDAAGYGFIHPATAEEKRLVRDYLRAWFRNADEYVAHEGWAGLFMGMRAEESRARRLNIATHGTVYQTATRPAATALPLSNWTGRDIWARHVECDLPYAESYDRADDRIRARSEWVFFAAETAWRHGQGQEISRVDPAHWARLTARWPELRRYA